MQHVTVLVRATRGTARALSELIVDDVDASALTDWVLARFAAGFDLHCPGLEYTLQVQEVRTGLPRSREEAFMFVLGVVAARKDYLEYYRTRQALPSSMSTTAHRGSLAWAREQYPTDSLEERFLGAMEHGETFELTPGERSWLVEKLFDDLNFRVLDSEPQSRILAFLLAGNHAPADLRRLNRNIPRGQVFTQALHLLLDSCNGPERALFLHSCIRAGVHTQLQDIFDGSLEEELAYHEKFLVLSEACGDQEAYLAHWQQVQDLTPGCQEIFQTLLEDAEPDTSLDDLIATAALV